MPDWNAVITQYGPIAWRVLWKLLGREHDVEDAFQETFVSAIRFATESEVENWEALIVRFATLRGMDRLRKRYRSRERFVSAPIGETPFDGLPSSSAGPHETAMASELSERLCIALTKLPQQQSEIFALSAIEGWTNDDIATNLQITPNHVRVLVHRARERLRELLVSLGNEHLPNETRESIR